MAIDGASTDIADSIVSAPQESPMLNADQVRKIVQREKAEAAEKAKREMQAQYEKELSQLKGSQQSVGGMQQTFDEEKMYSQFKDRLMKEAQEQQESAYQNQRQQEAHKIAGEYLGKMSKGKDLYSDFEQMTSTFEPEAFPQVVFLASKMENLPDIIYELSKNPSKLVMINDLAMRSPKMAEDQLQKLSESIKINQSAKENNISANPPLSRAQPSSTAGADSGAVSIRDFKKMPWLRG